MPAIDKRFALLRAGEPWYPVRIGGKSSPAEPTFRISGKGTRDAFGQAEQTTDIERVALAVLKEGLRSRFATEGGGPANGLALRGAKVTGWRLDPAIAARIGVPATGTTT